MRDHRRVPRLVWVTIIVALVYLLVSTGMLIIDLVTGVWASWDSREVTFKALSPIFLGFAGSSAGLLYRTHLPLSDRGLIRLESWPTLVVAVAMVMAPILCAYVLALILPPTLSAYSVIYVISMIAGLLLTFAGATVVVGMLHR